VLVVEIDAVRPQTLERFLDDFLDVLGPAVQANRAVDREAKLRGDLYLVANGLKSFADQLFVGSRRAAASNGRPAFRWHQSGIGCSERTQ